MRRIVQATRKGRVVIWVSTVLLLVFVGLAVYQWFAVRGHFVANKELLPLLETAKIPNEPPPPAGTGWPGWRGVRRDGVAYGPPLRVNWPAEGPPVLWRAKSGEGYSSFAVAGERAYGFHREGDEEVIVCYNLSDGNILWRQGYSCSPNDSIASGTGDRTRGPRASPMIDGDRLYTFGATGVLQCRKIDGGALVWEKDCVREFGAPIPRWGVSGSPLIDGDRVIFNPGGKNSTSVVALNKITGAEIWKAMNDPPGYSSPVVLEVDGERQYVVFTGNAVVGLEASSGAERWRHSWPTSFEVNAATPIVFHIQDGSQRHAFVLITSGYDKGCTLLRIIAKGGNGKAEMVYEGNQLCSHFATPVRRQEFVYGFNEADLVAMDLRNGQVRWSERGFHKGSLLAVEDYLIVLGEKGNLALVEANPEAFRKRAECEPFQSGRRAKCWSMPVLAEGRLLLRNEKEILCLDLRQ